MFRSLGLGLTLLVFASCSSTTPKSAREPSTENSKAKLLAYVSDIFRWSDYDQTHQHRVLHFPTRSASDVQPVTPADFLSEAGRDSDEIRRVFTDPTGVGEMSPRAKAQTDAWLRRQFQESFTETQRADLLKLCFSGPHAVGDRYPLAWARAEILCANPALLLTNSEIEKAFREFPAKPQGVTYDGEYGFYQYTDLKLAHLVRVLTAAANHQKMFFLSAFQALPPEKRKIFQTDGTSLSAEDQVDPFDLLSNATTGYIISKNHGRDPETDVALNKIQLSKLSQRAFAFALGLMGPENSSLHVSPAMSVMRSDSALSIFCANGIFETQEDQMSRIRVGNRSFGVSLWENKGAGTQLVEIWKPHYQLSEILKKGDTTLPFFCNTNEYRFVLRTQRGQAIPTPKPLDYSKQKELRALMTVSLVNEIDLSALQKGKLFISTIGGWTIEEDLKLVNTRAAFEEEFRKADAYVPVMHSMDVNYFHVGTGESYSLKVKRKIRDAKGVSRELKITLLLPSGSSKKDPLVMSPVELARLMDERYQKKPTPLFLMNNSCASEKTLLAWSLVFRRALELREKRGDHSVVTDFPYVIGSKRYFATGSTMEIFSHAEYPLESLKMLTAGASYNDVVNFLKKPSSDGFLNGITGFFSKKTDDLQSKKQGFEPESIMDYPELRSVRGIDISVQGRGIKGENRY